MGGEENKKMRRRRNKPWIKKPKGTLKKLREKK